VSEKDVRTPVIVRWKDSNGICEVELLNVSLRSSRGIIFGFECEKRGLADLRSANKVEAAISSSQLLVGNP
jgi:hypothetical protein